MRFKAVIFDLDGTLIDSIEDLADAANEMLQKHGFPVNPVDDYLRWVGDGVFDLIKRALPKHIEESKIAEYVSEFKENYKKMCLNKTKPYEGIMPLLSDLKKRKIKTAVLSNKADHFTMFMVEKIFKKGTFDLIFGERVGIPKKPDPCSAIELAQKLEIEADKILFVGDSPNDIKTAYAAGMMPVAVLWGYRNKKVLEDSGAKHFISQPGELLKFFDSN